MSDHSTQPCFVTGGSGFVGRAVVAAFAACGRPIRLALRQPWTGAALPDLVRPVQHALETDASAAALLHGCASVLHLAARAHVLYETAADATAAYRTTNTFGTLRLAQQAADAGVRRFVYVSSVKVHGESTAAGRPWTEDTPPEPQGAYALSKWEAEQGLAGIALRTGMEVVVVRPPLVYGAGAKANFAALIQALARGWPLPLGAIHNQRSLVGIDNLVDLLRLCLDHPAAANEVFLVSDGEDIATPQLVRRLAAAMGRPARLLPIPPTLLMAGGRALGRGAAVQRLCGNLQIDITKARTRLGWSPPVPLDEGLHRAVRVGVT